jgi:hypothetical protein
MESLRLVGEAKRDEIFLLKSRITADLDHQFRWKGRNVSRRVHDGDLSMVSDVCRGRSETSVHCGRRSSTKTKLKESAHTNAKTCKAW